MKSILLIVGVSMMVSGLAFAKPAWKKETGYDCKQCHVPGKFKEVPKDKPFYKVSQDKAAALGNPAKMTADMKAKFGDVAAKKNCNDCHDGKNKPAKK